MPVEFIFSNHSLIHFHFFGHIFLYALFMTFIKIFIIFRFSRHLSFIDLYVFIYFVRVSISVPILVFIP